MNFINSNKFIYSHCEVSLHNSTLGFKVRPLPSLPELRGYGLQFLVQHVWGSSFKTGLLAYYNGYCSWLFQATLRRLSFGTPPYGGSKVPSRFLSLDTISRSHFRPYRGTHDQGGCVILFFRRLGVRGLEPRHKVTV